MTEQDQGTVLAERHEQVAVLTLSYPSRRNAISLKLREALYAELLLAQGDPECRAIVLRGDGAHFCAGGDIASLVGVQPADGRERLRKLHRSIRILAAGTKPVIAAVEGAAMGAGLGVAAACDIVIAANDSKFSLPFTRFGLIPDYGTLWTIPQRIGSGLTKLLVMSGRTVHAEEAHQMGLIERVVEPGQALAEALALAKDIASGAPLANEFVKMMLARGYSSLDQLLDAEADAQGLLFGTADFAEGTGAFLDKRRPKFQGR